MVLLLTAATAGVILGAAIWTFVEYVLHRWVFHPGTSGSAGVRSRLSIVMSRDHLRHHRLPLRTSLALRAIAWMVTVAIGIGVILVTATASGLRTGLGTGGGAAVIGVCLGWALGFTLYELTHWRSHHVALRTRWARNLRRRHLAHHFLDPTNNFGVTVTWWDRAFGTFAPVDQVVVPRRHAPRFLLADTGPNPDETLLLREVGSGVEQ